MLKKIHYIVLIALLALGCQKKEKKQDLFEISINRIGYLTNKTKVNQLDSIYINDSIVKKNAGEELLRTSNEIEIYEKGGKKLLILEAKEDSNPLSTIENIQIIDPRYKTISGLSASSTFKDIKDHYTISKINNTLSTAVIFLDSIQAYLTIDKKELPEEFKHTTDLEIKASQIPDSAQIKHFLISWHKN